MTEGDRVVVLLPGSLRSWGLGGWHACTVLGRFTRIIDGRDVGIGTPAAAMVRVQVDGMAEPIDVSAERLETGDEAPLEDDETLAPEETTT